MNNSGETPPEHTTDKVVAKQDNPADAVSSPETPAPKKPTRIGDKLIELGLISKDQLQIALMEQKTSKKLLGSIMVDMGFVT
ncbi:MAG: hypothetical protein WCJ33_06050, partial [Pseudomonadota bacterium]